MNIPIYQTSTFQQKALGLHPEWEYARTGNPTRAALERLIAELEEDVQGFAFASGMAAITAVLSLFRAGDKVLISSNVYGGTYRVLDKVFSAFDLHYAIADTDNLNVLEKEITPDVKAILVESPANPLMTVTDIRGVAAIAKRHDVLTIVDNTFMTPYLQKPLTLGADTMRAIQASMKRQTESVYADETGLLETPYTGFHFRLWRDYVHSSLPLAGPIIARAMHYAFGVQALVRGVKLVPGPMGTGGGYLYSAMRAVQDSRNLPDSALLDALFIAAGVGAIAYTRTNPTGEVTGCAGECGVCGAMAAAAITYMMGGSPRQVEAAASLTLQAALGWPCDPIPGGQNQPCMSRVLTAVVMSIVFSDASLSGRDAVLPFHEVVDAIDVMGRGMSSDLLCTSRGGMCATPTGRRSRKDFQDWYKSIL